MPAYLVAWLTVNDSESMIEYREKAPDLVRKYGGKYLFTGPGAEALEGDWKAHGMAMIEFPTYEDAKRWYESDEYAPLRAARQGGADSSIILTPDVQPVR